MRWNKPKCQTCQKAAPRNHKFCSLECQLRSHVRYEGACWLWVGHINKSTGKGLLRFQSKYLHVPTVVGGLAGLKADRSEMIGTTCGERLCCNPAHAVIAKRTTWKGRSDSDKTQGDTTCAE